MVDYVALRNDSSSLLGTPVTAAGLFVIDIGVVKPMAGGVAGAMAGDAALEALGVDSALASGLVEGVGFVHYGNTCGRAVDKFRWKPKSCNLFRRQISTPNPHQLP